MWKTFTPCNEESSNFWESVEKSPTFAGYEPGKNCHHDPYYNKAYSGVMHYLSPSSSRTRCRIERILMQAVYTPNNGPRNHDPSNKSAANPAAESTAQILDVRLRISICVFLFIATLCFK